MNAYKSYIYHSTLEAASINTKFKEFWKKTSGACDSRYPTVHSLRYSFVVKRMNLWMEEGKNLTATAVVFVAIICTSHILVKKV